MKVVAIIQARMNSARLPGKVLADIAGKPMLQWVVETCEAQFGIDQTVVATSVEDADAPVAAWCVERGVACVQGDLENVFQRFIGVCKQVPSDVFFRVNADSPLVNQHLLEQARVAHGAEMIDLVTNIHPRTYPPGVSVEAIRTKTFRGIRDELGPEEREHVTRHFYENDGRYRIRNLVSPVAFPNTAHLAIDTAKDRSRVESLIESLPCHPGELAIEDLADRLQRFGHE